MTAFKSLKPRLCHEILTIELQMILLESASPILSRGGAAGRGWLAGPRYSSHHNQHRLAENQQLYPSCHQTLTKSKVGERQGRSTEHREWDWRHDGHIGHTLGNLRRVCGRHHHECLDQLWQMSHFFIDHILTAKQFPCSYATASISSSIPRRHFFPLTNFLPFAHRHQILSYGYEWLHTM